MTVQTVTPVRRRVELDRLRGLAVLLMIGDHVSILVGLSLFRVTGGRLAMPLFFILAGHLAGRLSVRHLYVGLLGLVLPVFVVFVDRPNVLFWLALGSAVLWVFRRVGWSVWPLLVVSLTLAANGWSVHPGSLSYDPVALLALMALGAVIAPESLTWARRLPAWFEVIGRRPLSWYVGHVVFLQLVIVALGLTVNV